MKIMLQISTVFGSKLWWLSENSKPLQLHRLREIGPAVVLNSGDSEYWEFDERIDDPFQMMVFSK